MRQFTVQERTEIAKKDLGRILTRASRMLNAPTPNYSDPDLQLCIDVLKSHRGFVKASCGAPWNDEWSSPGECHVCKCRVDRKEKGVHCPNGNIRMCWTCMCDNIDWERIAKEAQNSDYYEVPNSSGP